ncbi:hypothetical protein C8J57DRAFT_1504717 [Mycena rebaudengoi]|nr:hypothetical protein C8J57DRAFT_1504717 [Mycena rebaudengoi]
MYFYTPLLKVTSAVTSFAQQIFTVRIEGFRNVSDLQDGSRVNIVPISGERPLDFLPFALTIEQLSALAMSQTAEKSFEPLEDGLVIMHFNQPWAGLELQPCTVVTFSPGGPQPFWSALAVAAEWRTERRRCADAQGPRWHVVKGGAWLEALSLADLVHEWRLGCHAPIPFHHRSVCGMDVTDDELITSMLTYPRELGHRAGVPSNVPSSPSCPTPTYRPATIPVSSSAARNSSEKRSAVEMAADSSSDDDEARSSKRLKSSVPTTTRLFHRGQIQGPQFRQGEGTPFLPGWS